MILDGLGRFISSIICWMSAIMPLCVWTSAVNPWSSSSWLSHSNQWQLVLHRDILIRRLSQIMTIITAPRAMLAVEDPKNCSQYCVICFLRRILGPHLACDA